jgi:ABC-type phosphate transport system substrate-binding protein
VIVHAGVAGKSAPKRLLADIFLRRAVRWGDGAAIRPVDLSLTTPVRKGFTRIILGLSSLELQQHWRSAISRGITPPPVKPSEEEVIAFVASNPGAIGYVADSTPTPETVKVLSVE